MPYHSVHADVAIAAVARLRQLQKAVEVAHGYVQAHLNLADVYDLGRDIDARPSSGGRTLRCLKRPSNQF